MVPSSDNSLSLESQMRSRRGSPADRGSPGCNQERSRPLWKSLPAPLIDADRVQSESDTEQRLRPGGMPITVSKGCHCLATRSDIKAKHKASDIIKGYTESLLIGGPKSDGYERPTQKTLAQEC